MIEEKGVIIFKDTTIPCSQEDIKLLHWEEKGFFSVILVIFLEIFECIGEHGQEK